MPTFTKFDCFTQDVGRGVHNLNSDTINCMLTNVAPNGSTDTVTADISEISSAGGYSAGGVSLTTTSYAQSSGVSFFLCDDITFTAVAGTFGPFRYAVVYNLTASGGPLIGYIDHGSGISITNPDSYIIQVDPVLGLFTIG